MNIKENLADYKDLKKAVNLLQSPSITAKISNLIGSPIETAVKKLPPSATGKIQKAVEAALTKAAEAALWSMKNTPHEGASTKLHKLMAAASGALGGAFGFATLFAELPLSTVIMMRAVADVARSEGFDLNDFSTKKACIEVFGLGGHTKSDDGTDTGYYVMRTFTTEATSVLYKELLEVAARQAAAQQTAASVHHFTGDQAGKALAKVIESVAKAFGVTITEKMAAQFVPVVGAVTGASLNMLFTDFYQDMARGHFIVRRLEAKYGFELIKAEYKALCA